MIGNAILPSPSAKRVVMLKNLMRLSFFLLSSLASVCFANLPTKADLKIDTNSFTKHPFYIGITGGYGSTTWGQLVPPQSKANAAINLSTPSRVNEGGAIWGVFAGYEIIPTFGIEGSYTRYPIADLFFDQNSLFTPVWTAI